MRYRIKRKISNCYYHNSIKLNAKIDGKPIAFTEIPKGCLLVKSRTAGIHLSQNCIDENADWAYIFQNAAIHKLGISHILYHGVPIEDQK